MTIGSTIGAQGAMIRGFVERQTDRDCLVIITIFSTLVVSNEFNRDRRRRHRRRIRNRCLGSSCGLVTIELVVEPALLDEVELLVQRLLLASALRLLIMLPDIVLQLLYILFLRL